MAVTRVTVWETAAPPNFICLCVCVSLSYYSLHSFRHINACPAFSFMTLGIKLRPPLDFQRPVTATKGLGLGLGLVLGIGLGLGLALTQP